MYPQTRGAVAYQHTSVQSSSPLELVVLLYDGAPDNNGTIVASQRIPHLAAHGDAFVRVSWFPESCGKQRFVAVAGAGLPIAEERESMPVMVDCGGRRASR